MGLIFVYLSHQVVVREKGFLKKLMIGLIQGIQPIAFLWPLAAHQGHFCHHLHPQINTTAD